MSLRLKKAKHKELVKQKKLKKFNFQKKKINNQSYLLNHHLINIKLNQKVNLNRLISKITRIYFRQYQNPIKKQKITIIILKYLQWKKFSLKIINNQHSNCNLQLESLLQVKIQNNTNQSKKMKIKFSHKNKMLIK